ncbi:protein delta homolog 1-like [Saccoglossus kowalevskii]|uniref:Neurogenic locus notch homolog protein 1-like n=1 Tax=Saccoglossus kowalevskii TaxID=10224 RepID=A0ABM0MNF7_SACKO|nr:PREDICTED: neurogenic locus notch homolog protein 1-like [Saccoglossus kowalevskii]
MCAMNRCLNGGICVIMKDNTEVCSCQVGWTGSRCESDINECEENEHLCVHGECLNAPNGQTNYTCNCKNGWEGKFCHIPIYECTSNPCRNGGTCKDHEGYYVCTCKEGYSGDNCEQVNPQVIDGTAKPSIDSVGGLEMYWFIIIIVIGILLLICLTVLCVYTCPSPKSRKYKHTV